jgi:OOP family OmpA-OmpF porin
MAARFGLGAQAGPLLGEVFQMISRQSGGLSGVIDKFKSAGLGAQVSSWLGKADAPPLANEQIEKVLGTAAVQGMASKLGLGNNVVSSALAYAVPKIIGQLTPGGTIPTGIPTAVTSYLSQYEKVEPLRMDVVKEREPVRPVAAPPTSFNWLYPILGLLALGALLWYLFSPRETEHVATAPAPATQTAPAPAPAPVAQATEPRLWLSNDNGVVSAFGAVRDEATRKSIIDSLQAVFGADKVKADIGLDANAVPLSWLTNFKAALDNLKTPGVQAVLDNKSIGLGGISDVDRDKIVGAWKSLFGAGVNVGPLADQVTTWVNGSLNALKSSLQGVTDVASAQALLPKLTDATTQLNRLSAVASHLSADQKKLLAGAGSTALPVVNGLFDKILAIPGVSAIAKSGIDSLRTQLDALAKA